MLQALRTAYLPNTVWLLCPVDGDATISDVEQLISGMASYRMLDEKATAYVCKRFACQQPTTDVDAMLQQLDAVHAGTDRNIG